jgi:gliding motility-associated-like protein
VLQPITGNTVSAAKPAVCFDTAPDPITGGTLAEGAGPGTYIYLWEQSSNGGITWTAASGTNTTANYQPPVLKIPMKYRRTVKSGVFNCTSISSSPIDIAINPLPSSIINAGPDVPGYYSIEKIFHMNADPVLTGESGSWSVAGNGSGSIVDFSNNKAVVRNLSVGSNTFIWTITNGLCNIDDTVSITLLEDFIPQGFSPNGDAWNNTFIVEGLNLTDQEVEMKVVNGAGTQVFSTSNRQGQTWTDWDGKNSRGFDLPEGTYYYLLKVTSKDGQVFKKSGFIVLKRY